MKLTPDTHLTYCLNVHPGTDWAQNLDNIRTHATQVRDLLKCDQAFGLGLRISAEASETLCQDVSRNELAHYLKQENMYAFTVNAFPYAAFHGEAVKEKVYQPDWTTEARVDYTNRVVSILAELLPADCSGSVSTVPCSYKVWIENDQQIEDMCHNLADAVMHMSLTERITGKYIHLGLEPEPDCFLETTDETIAFLTGPMKEHAVPHIRSQLNVSAEEAEAKLYRHLGVCLDTCHSALQFEDPTENIRKYVEAGILISKIQISAALECNASPEALQALRAFEDPVYLHQVKARDTDAIQSYPDLPAALDTFTTQPAPDTTLRTHFHVPVYFTSNGPLSSTSPTMTDAFWAAAIKHCEHLEIETYTFDVLPDDVRPDSVSDSTAREYEWLLGRLPDAN